MNLRPRRESNPRPPLFASGALPAEKYPLSTPPAKFCWSYNASTSSSFTSSTLARKPTGFSVLEGSTWIASLVIAS
jgi:hypothetical protein